MLRTILFLNLTGQKCTSRRVRELVFNIPSSSPTSNSTARSVLRHGLKVSNTSRDALFVLAVSVFKDVFGYDLVSTNDAPILRVEARHVKKRIQKNITNDSGDRKSTL